MGIFGSFWLEYVGDSFIFKGFFDGKWLLYDWIFLEFLFMVFFMGMGGRVWFWFIDIGDEYWKLLNMEDEE